MCIFRLLKADEIEVKVKQITENGAVAFLYKTARTDMDLLDETFGAVNWECDYKDIKGNLYCGIGVRQADDSVVWKWDCGIESREDGEGNEKKGEASDAFKRAGTKWGIGRELYTSPFIFLNVVTLQCGKDSKGNPKYKLANFPTFDVAEIGYDDNRRINRLKICDNSGKKVYSYCSEKTDVSSSGNKNNDDWVRAYSNFLEVGGNPEALAKFCCRKSAEFLSVEELETATRKKIEAKTKAAI